MRQSLFSVFGDLQLYTKGVRAKSEGLMRGRNGQKCTLISMLEG